MGTVTRARSTTRRWVRLLAVPFALTLLAAACGDDDDDASAGDTTTAPADAGTTTAPAATTTAASTPDAGATTTAPPETTTSIELTDSFRGVTAESIKLGILMVDYECIADFIDFERGDQELAYQSFVDAINADGGVLGRQIEPVYQMHCPIGNEEALAACVAMTQDEEVFATLGVFIDFTGDAQLCLTRDNETIHIGHELEQAWIDESPPGLLLTGDLTAERTISVLMAALAEAGTLEGRTVGVLASARTGARAENVIEPALDELGVERGSTAILDIVDEDTTQAQAQLDAFLELWRGEGIDTLIVAGQEAGSDTFVKKVREVFPDILLISDASSGIIVSGKDASVAGITPNPYEGTISIGGLNDSNGEQYNSDLIQECISIFEAANPDIPVTDPQDLVVAEGEKRVETYITVRDACSDLSLFKQVAERAGADLTNESWTEAVNNFGSFEYPGNAFSSFTEGKYDANDGARLQAFDSSIGEDGGWKDLTEIFNTAE
jgi:Periplasmic binding protein